MVSHSTVSVERAPIFFLAKDNKAAYRYSGLDMSEGEVREQARRITAEAMQILTGNLVVESRRRRGR
jgi:hypothetical protein